MTSCPACSGEQPEGSLVCSRCGTLIWRDRLRELYAESKLAESERNWDKNIQLLSECLSLLPPGTERHLQIQMDIRKASHYINARPPTPNPESLESPDLDGAPTASPSALVLGSLRSIMRGLTKPKTLVSLALWTVLLSFLMGFSQALIFGLMIYVHEMGHLIAIQYYGYRFSWPVFIPFLGAFVLQEKQSESAYKNIVISLAGPLAGSLLSFVVLLLSSRLELPEVVTGTAYLNLLINFLNLMPVWLLDGARIAKRLNRGQSIALSAGLFLITVVDFNGFALIMFSAWFITMLLYWNKPPAEARKAAPERRGIRLLNAIIILLLAASALVLKQSQPNMIRDEKKSSLKSEDTFEQHGVDGSME